MSTERVVSSNTQREAAVARTKDDHDNDDADDNEENTPHSVATLRFVMNTLSYYYDVSIHSLFSATIF